MLERSSGIEETGRLKWELALILLMCWVIVYFCIWKGPKSTGKVGIYTVKYRLQEVLHNRFGFVFPNLVLRLGGIFLGHLFKLGFGTL